MIAILLIKKNGDIESQEYKNLKKDDLYKKCNYRKVDDFEQQSSWKVKMNGKSVRVCVYGKNVGKSNMVNKFEFPPPIDTKLLYGTLAITKEIDDMEPYEFTVWILNRGNVEDIYNITIKKIY